MNHYNIKNTAEMVVKDSKAIYELNKHLKSALQIADNNNKNIENYTLDELVKENQKLSLIDKEIYLINVRNKHLFKVKTLKILITAEDEIKKLNDYFDKNKNVLGSIFRNKIKMDANEVLATLNKDDKIIANIELGTNHLIYEQQVKHSSKIMSSLNDNKKLDENFKYYVLTGTHINKDFKEDTKPENIHCKELTQSIVESKGFKADYGVAVSKHIGRANTVDTYKELFKQNPNLVDIIKSKDNNKKIVVNTGISAFAYRTQSDLLLYLLNNGVSEEQFKNHFIFTSMPLNSLMMELCDKTIDINSTKQEQQTAEKFITYRNSIVIDNLARTFYTRKNMFKKISDNLKITSKKVNDILTNRAINQLTIKELEEQIIEK